MNKRSIKTLQRVQENDPTLKELNVNEDGGVFGGATDNDIHLDLV